MMEGLAAFLRLEFLLFLGGLALVVVFQLLVGRIRTSGILSTDSPEGISPGRVQMLAVTLLGALWYFSLLAESPTALPDIPKELLLVLGGSQGLYLGGKGIQFLRMTDGEVD